MADGDDSTRMGLIYGDESLVFFITLLIQLCSIQSIAGLQTVNVVMAMVMVMVMAMVMVMVMGGCSRTSLRTLVRWS